MITYCKCGCGELLNNLYSKTQTNKGHHHRLPEIKEKKRIICLQKYGVENPSQSKEIKQQKKNTCLQHYGVENPQQSKEVQEKSKQTCLEKFGVNHSMQLQSIREKSKQTCLKNFGVTNPFQSEIIKDKIKKTCLEKYGTESTNTLNWVKEKQKKTCVNRYGVDNHAKTLKGRQASRESLLRDLNKNLLKIGRIGNLENDCLIILQKECSYKFQRIELFGFLPDSYIEELNMIIEFDEPYHNGQKQKEKDHIKNETMKSKNIFVFRIKQKDWIDNQNNIIMIFRNIINERQKILYQTPF